jgi:formyl-CoA transferase
MFHASDGVFNFSATTTPMWIKLCRHVQLDGLIDDPRFATSSARRDNRTELERLIGERFKLRSRDQWIAELRGLGMPAGPVYDVSEVFADPQVIEGGMVETIEHPTVGQLRQLASPIGLECFSGGSVRKPPPRLGEHTWEVLTELGITTEKVDELAKGHVISTPGD